MNVRNPMGVLHYFFIKNVFYDKNDKMDLRLFYFQVIFIYIYIFNVLLKNIYRIKTHNLFKITNISFLFRSLINMK